MLTRNRRLAAIVMLAVMAVNFTTEGYALYAPRVASLLKQVRAAVAEKCDASAVESGCCSGGSTEATGGEPGECCSAEANTQPKTGSCCSSAPTKPEPKPCGCPDCGDVCPMGDACTCSIYGHGNTFHSEALFFRAPGCHPAQETFGASYFPLSMRVVFTESGEVACSHPAVVSVPLAMPDPHLTGHAPAPLVPPPRHARA